MDSILLATDGSEYARQAARRAIEMASGRGAKLHVLCVVDKRRFNEPALSSSEIATIYADDHAAITLADVRDMAEQFDLAIAGETRHGVPDDVILEYASEVDADVIVIGEHGDHHDHFSGVGHQVTKRADTDVVVVKANE